MSRNNKCTPLFVRVVYETGQKRHLATTSTIRRKLADRTQGISYMLPVLLSNLSTIWDPENLSHCIWDKWINLMEIVIRSSPLCPNIVRFKMRKQLESWSVYAYPYL